MYHKKWLGIATRSVLTMCLSLALCIDMGIPGALDSQIVEQAGQAVAQERVEPVWRIIGLAAKGSLVTPLFFLLLWANWKIDGQKTGRKLAFPIVSGFIAVVWLMAEGFRVDDTLWTLYASYVQIAKSIIYFVGITYGLNQITYFLYGALEKSGTKNLEGAPADQRAWHSQIVRAYRKHTFLVSFGAVFALWLPHLILAYPAYFCRDAYNQLAQFFGLLDYSNHHPVASTLFMGGLVKAGSLISGNFGLFLYIVVQAIIGACVLAYSLYLMRELHTPVWLRLLAFGSYVIVPYYTNYIAVFLKDVVYSYAVLLFVIELIYLLILNEGFFRSKRHILLLAASIAGSILLRNNGRYMLYPVIAAVLFYLFLRRRKSGTDDKGRRYTLYPAVAVLLVPVLLAEVSSASMLSYLNAKPGSIGEALSLPFQQTARYVKEFGDEITEEEKTAISAVLDYDSLAEKYNPKVSDPVKWLYKQGATTEELREYLLVWLRQFTKHPLVYIGATVNQNYYLLYPYIPNNAIYVNRISDSWVGENAQKELVELLGLHDIEVIASLDILLESFYTIIFYCPGLNMLSHPALYVSLLIWLTMFALYKKRFLWLLASLPLWLSAVIVVLAPVIQGNARYAFPIIYAMPAILAYYIYWEKT